MLHGPTIRRLSRRQFGAVAAAAIASSARAARAATRPRVRVRAITAGVTLASLEDRAPFERAFRFLETARAAYERDGWEVQTTRIASQPLGEYAHGWASTPGLTRIAEIDRLCARQQVVLSLGPVMTEDTPDPDFARKAVDFAAAAPATSFTVFAASPERGIHSHGVRAAAEAIVAIARATPGGVGNFNFAATALCPAGSPFFPAAYHAGSESFAVGLESPNLITDAARATGEAGAADRVRASLERALGDAARLAQALARSSGRRYGGIDASPAPGLDASIGEAIESLSGVPFGEPGTLRACAAVTTVLKSLPVETCGYSGLMLPVLEDPVLARRAGEKRFTLGELLLFSSVCGTGLDVAPLPGDVSAPSLARLIGDVAALAVKHQKPLSARLFPTPGKSAGELAHFDNPYLVDAVVMEPR